MHNIHELMKIIKEVNSDGIINNKEVSFFQFWVDKNRNLAYDKKQSELIILIDTILKNRVIENDTRTVLLEKLEKLLSKVGDKSMNIYELHNIIEGIICDGKVNKFELYHLKKWMKENGNFIKGDKLTKDLYIIINNILEKNIITEEEWQNLLHLLSNIIKYTQFETKINYLCTQIKARKNIGLDLINILDNEFEISKIHDKAERYLLDALESESNFCINPEIIFISLVLIAMLKYDGNYYDNVRSTYKDLSDFYLISIKNKIILEVELELLMLFWKMQSYRNHFFLLFLNSFLIFMKEILNMIYHRIHMRIYYLYLKA